MAVHILQDGKIIRTEMEPPHSKVKSRTSIQYKAHQTNFVTYRACGSCFSMMYTHMGFETGQQRVQSMGMISSQSWSSKLSKP